MACDTLQEGYTSMNTLTHHAPLKTIRIQLAFVHLESKSYPQESFLKAVTWEEALSNLLSNMPDIIDNPNEELAQEFLLESWV